MPTQHIPDIAIVGSFSIDSVLTPDGKALPAKPGGNALWSALGAWLAGHQPGIVARIGSDYPQPVLDRLNVAGFDLSALTRIDQKHPVRICYAHMPDGSRVQPVRPEMIAHLPEAQRAEFVDHTRQPDILIQGSPQTDDIPEAWLQSVGHWHLPLLPLERHREMVAFLAKAPGLVQADCPARPDLTEEPFGKLARTLPALDVFLPSTSDLEVIAPDLSVERAIKAFRGAGARTIVLKAGGEGLFVDDGTGLMSMIAYPGEPVDPTGAGDTFCGGFLAARAEGADLLTAAALGSACASFAVATADPMALLDVSRADVRRRAELLLTTAEPVIRKPRPWPVAPTPEAEVTK